MGSKLQIASLLLLLAVTMISAGTFVETSVYGKQDQPGKPHILPQPGLINDLDKVLQLRFLTAPNFGIRRIGPNPNPHLERFEPHTAEETEAVNNLQSGQWKVAVYLFGRRGYQQAAQKDPHAEKGLIVQYKLNNPVPVTNNFKKGELARPRNLQDGVDEAFLQFATAESHEFSLGKWSYVARAVRARESCLKCHTDLFTDELDSKKWAYRSRRVGDPIGVLVYAFSKKS
jgi:hypothetical protein